MVGLVIDSVQTEEEEKKITEKKQNVSLTQIIDAVVHHDGCYSS